jgi:hypothetical protein
MPIYIAALFIALVAALLVLAIRATSILGATLNLPRPKRVRLSVFTASTLVLWLLITAALAQQGFFAQFDALPPRFVFAVAPPLITIGILRFSRLRDFLAAAPAAWLINFQFFRVVMEVILWLLFINNLIPQQMTFEGRNFDILAGLTAPIVGYLVFKQKALPVSIAVVWNFLSLALLLNIVTIAVLSAPGPLRVFHNEPANTIVAFFPFIWLPAFVVPAAMFGHVMSLYQLSKKVERVEARVLP